MSAASEFTRALGMFAFGGPEVLEIVEHRIPDLGPADVRIRVHAAGVNPADLLFRSGFREDVLREFAPPWVPGMDAAGIVEAVGEEVDHLRTGDRVMALVNHFLPSGGAQSEVIVVAASSVVPIAPELSFAAAATLSLNGLTATEALDQLAVPEGGTLAITGGAGWLATLATRLARRRGIRVLVDAPPDEIDRVAGYGADHVVAMGEGVASRFRELAPDGVNGVIDAAAIGPDVFGAIRDGGAWATLRFQKDEPPRGISRHEIMVTARMGDREALGELARLAAAGELPAEVAAIYRPEQAGDAHRLQATGTVRGRLVLVF